VAEVAEQATDVDPRDVPEPTAGDRQITHKLVERRTRSTKEEPMATDTAKVLDQLGKMTVLELVELKNAIEEEWASPAAARWQWPRWRLLGW